jgi:WG containing repeat
MNLKIAIYIITFAISNIAYAQQDLFGIGTNFRIVETANKPDELQDANGKVVYSADKLYNVILKPNRILVKNKGYWGMIDTTLRTIIPVEYIAPVNDFTIDDGAHFTAGRIFGLRNKQGLWGGMDSDGNTIIPFKFQNIEIIMNEEDTMKNGKNDYYSKFHDAYAQTDKGVFQIDAKGNIISKRIADTLLRSFSPDVMMLNEGKLVAYNNNTKDFQDFAESDGVRTKFYYDGCHFAFGNTNAERITPFIYDELGQDENYLYPVRIGKNWGIYDTKQQQYTVEPIHNKVIMTSVGRLVVKNTDHKWTIINTDEPDVQEFLYDSVAVTLNSFIAAQKGKKWAITYKEKPASGFIYDEIDFESVIGYVIVKNNGKYGIRHFDKNKELFKTIYTAINRIDDPTEGTLKVYGTRDNKRHWLNLDTGKEND